MTMTKKQIGSYIAAIKKQIDSLIKLNIVCRQDNDYFQSDLDKSLFENLIVYFLQGKSNRKSICYYKSNILCEEFVTIKVDFTNDIGTLVTFSFFIKDYTILDVVRNLKIDFSSDTEKAEFENVLSTIK